MPQLHSKPANGFNSKRDHILIHGARVNNLKNIDVSIPRNQLVVITGLSGSGKSSLAFDVVYAEGNRRYLEGMSSYARQFLDVNGKPDVDKIENLSPTISIDQRSLARSPRSTVGTLTEIYDYLRVLFAKVGTPYCPNCGKELSRVESKEILEEILALPDRSSVMILSRIASNGKSAGELLKYAGQLGFARARIGGRVILIQEALASASGLSEESIEVVVDRILFRKQSPDHERILDSIETGMRLSRGSVIVSSDENGDRLYHQNFVCADCGFEMSEITPKHFSFNSPEGACRSCSGLGVVREVDPDLIIPNKNLTLAEGAIIPWAKSGGRQAGANQLEILRALGERYGFSINVPVRELKREHLSVIFYGAKERSLDVKTNGDGKKIEFTGVIPILKKRYEEASVNLIRSDLERYMVERTCPFCEGKRLREEILAIQVLEKSINDITSLDIGSFINFLSELANLEKNRNTRGIVGALTREMNVRAEAVKNVGLDYLSLNRSANTLSGGEGQRIRLATQISSELMGITYILDEPSIGLHQRDTEKLMATLKALKDAGNSLIVVEHDPEIIKQADWVIDMGPGAGEFGGEVIFSGTYPDLLSSKNITGKYLKGTLNVSNRKKERGRAKQWLDILGAEEHNLKNINVSIPLGRFVTISGVSGSGKSTLINDVLGRALSRYFWNTRDLPGKHRKIEGLKYIDKVIAINQSPIGRTPRSNAATYTGVFSLIREVFAETQEAKKQGWDASRFSFNMKGGRCENCQGDGAKRVEMHLLPDMYIECETCAGTRYNRKTLDIEYQGANIAQVLDMSVSYALKFFRSHPGILEKLNTLEEVGLGYLKLGQSATNMSGGEAQRIKLATELARRSTGKTLYILDEPTIGLHFEDVKKLLLVLDALVEKGNTVMVVEHSLDIIRHSDWVIDLGPEGGKAGGQVIYAGPPGGLKKCKRSWTGKYL